MLTGGRDFCLDDPLSPTTVARKTLELHEIGCLKERTMLATQQILSFGFQKQTGDNFDCQASRCEAWLHVPLHIR